MLWANFLHFYQPPTQKKYWIDRITNECYRKLVQHLLDNERAKLTLNVNGVLCELWEKYGHNDVIEGIKVLVARNQIELTGSAKYHPLLPKIPDHEIKRQVYLNEASLFKYFGAVGPLLKSTLDTNVPLNAPEIKGFFPPEMAYSKELASVISDLGYKWIIAEELSYAYSFGKVDFSKIYKVKDTNLNIFFRDRFSSFKLLSGQISTEHLFFEEFRNKSSSNEYLLTAMDGETFGHHRPGLDLTLAEIYKGSNIKFVQVSELEDLFPETVVCETLPSTWALMETDITKGVPFARWLDEDNEIHKMQWELTNLAIESVNKSKHKLDGYEFAENDLWVQARMLLDSSLHSDQYWWASAKPWWSLEMIERGAKELSDVIKLLPDASENLKKKAENLYVEIIKAGFDWQRSGKVDELSQKNDEEIIMNINEDLSKYSIDKVNEMISIQEKEMKELAKNLEFERAIHPRNRIRELKEYLERKSI